MRDLGNTLFDILRLIMSTSISMQVLGLSAKAVTSDITHFAKKHIFTLLALHPVWSNAILNVKQPLIKSLTCQMFAISISQSDGTA